MANTFFKSFAESDRTSSRTLLHEAIPITGTLVSGTYSANSNIKTFSHGMFQSVYDYPYASSSANHIFDVTYGYHASSSFFGASNTQHSKKSNIYSQMAQVLSGFDTDSKIRRFDQDGDFAAGGPKYDEAFVLTFSRLLTKDEIKKGSFSMTLGEGSTYAAPFAATTTITDTGAATSYNVNSPAGEYGLLKTTAAAASVTFDFTNAPDVGDACTILALNATGSTTSATFTCTATTSSATQFGRDGVNNGAPNFVIAIGLSPIAALVTVARAGDIVTVTQVNTGAAGNTSIVSNLANVTVGGAAAAANGTFSSGHDLDSIGLLYYQAGIAILSSSVLGPVLTTQMDAAGQFHGALATGSNIDALGNAFLHRVQNIQFNNTTELNSTIYFCRANHNEFNYSSNPTYLSGSKILVKNNDNQMPPRSYATTVGLYSADNELLAVAKLSEPLRKDPTNELTLRVRLDY